MNRNELKAANILVRERVEGKVYFYFRTWLQMDSCLNKVIDCEAALEDNEKWFKDSYSIIQSYVGSKTFSSTDNRVLANAVIGYIMIAIDSFRKGYEAMNEHYFEEVKKWD